VRVKRKLEGKEAGNQVDREQFDFKKIIAYSSSR
jgi:hypothetical protein